MNFKIEKLLKKYYGNIPDQPDPKGKEKIIEILSHTGICEEENKLRYMEFIFCQFLYMNKNMWILQIILLLFCLAGILFLRNDLWIIAWVSAMLPLIILGGMLEISKSFSDDVMELEMVTKFDLRQLLTARILITGLINFISLSIVFVLSGIRLQSFSFFALVYMSVPFIMTILFCTIIVNKVTGKEGKTLIIIIGCSISLITARFSFYYPQIYRESMFKLWCTILIVLLVLLMFQMTQLLRKSINRLDRTIKMTKRIVEDHNGIAS